MFPPGKKRQHHQLSFTTYKVCYIVFKTDWACKRKMLPVIQLGCYIHHVICMLYDFLYIMLYGCCMMLYTSSYTDVVGCYIHHVIRMLYHKKLMSTFYAAVLIGRTSQWK